MKRFYLLTVLLLIVTVFIPFMANRVCGASVPQGLFREDFESYDEGKVKPRRFSQWQGATSVNYAIENDGGNKVLRCTPESGIVSLILNGDKELTDYTVSVKVKPGNGEGRSMRAGLVVRCLDKTTWYQYMIRGNEKKLYLLSRIKGGREKEVAPPVDIPNFDPNKWYKLTLKVSGADPVQLTAYLDDQIQFGGVQTPSDIIPNGRFGLYSYSAKFNPPQIAPSHCYDDVEVTQP